MNRLIISAITAMMILTVSCSTKQAIGEGSSLEDLLKLYPKYKIEVYYSEMGSYEYTSVESMLKGYGESWSSAYNDWAIFTPLNTDGDEAEIRYFLSFKNLDNRDTYQKESKVWMVQDNSVVEALLDVTLEFIDIDESDDPDETSDPAPPGNIVGTWRAPTKPNHVAYLEIDIDGIAGLYLGDANSDQLYEIYRGTVLTVSDNPDEIMIAMDFDLNWYIYESENGAPITGVPDSYKGTYTLRRYWADDKEMLHVIANDDASPLFGKKELKMEWSPKTEDSGHMVDLES